MQPNQNPYDFLNAPAPKKSFGATTQKGRLLQVAIFGGLLLIVAIVAFNLIFGGNSGPKKPLLEVAAVQADILALTSQGSTNIRDGSLKTKSTMIALTTTTQSSDTNKLLASYGAGKNVAKQAKIYQDTSYVNQLKTAATNNTYDATYQKILADKLGLYRAKLTNAYNAISSTKQKTQISDFYQQLELLAPSTVTQ